MKHYKHPPKFIVLFKRVLFLFYGPILFVFIGLAPLFCGRKKGFRNWYWRILRRVFRVWMKALSIRIDIDEKSLVALSEHKGTVIAVNHKSHLDVLALEAIMPDDRWVTFAAKIELNKVPFFKWGFAGSGILPIDRNKGITALQSLIDSYSLADPRVSLAMFVEGTRVNGHELGKFKVGAINIARNFEKEIQPICIFGTYDLMPRHRAIPGVGVITIRVLENFKVGANKKVREEIAALHSYMSAEYNRLGAEIRSEKT